MPGKTGKKVNKIGKSHGRTGFRKRAALTHFLRAGLLHITPGFADRTSLRLEGSIILANEVVLLQVRIAGVSGRQTGSLDRHPAGTLTLRQTGGGNGSNDHFGGSDDWWENGETLVALEAELEPKPWAFGRRWAGREALGEDLRAFTGRGANSATAIEDQTFWAWMAGDAGAFADQILVTSFVIRVDHVSDSFVAPLESRAAKAFVTFADDAVDAAVSAA